MSTTIHSSSSTCRATSGCERSRLSTTSYHSYLLGMFPFYVIQVSFLCRLRHFPLVIMTSLYPVSVKFSTTFSSLCVPNVSTVFLNISVLFASILLKASSLFTCLIQWYSKKPPIKPHQLSQVSFSWLRKLSNFHCHIRGLIVVPHSFPCW